MNRHQWYWCQDNGKVFLYKWNLATIQNLKNSWGLQFPPSFSFWNIDLPFCSAAFFSNLNWIFFHSAAWFFWRYLFLYFVFPIRFMIFWWSSVRYFLLNQFRRSTIFRYLWHPFCSLGQMCLMLLLPFRYKCSQNSNWYIPVINLIITKNEEEGSVYTEQILNSSVHKKFKKVNREITNKRSKREWTMTWW